MKRFGSFQFDSADECLWHNGARIALQPKLFAVLRYLVENPGRLITHDELLDALWPETYVQQQVLRTYVLELRKVLGDDARQPQFIESVPKRGYRFVSAVSETEAVPRVSAAVPEETRIVGRTCELAALAQAYEQAAGGVRQVMLVTGDFGIGKTTLVDAFCEGLKSSASVARGQCVQGLARREEYYPVLEALSHLCASDVGDQACRVLARLAPGWLAALGRETGSAQSAPPRTAGDLCAALEELAAERPLLLIFEDLHWADDSTLHLISALARRRAPARLFLLATSNCRHPAASHALRQLMHDLIVRRLCTEIALRPLDKAAVREWLRRHFGEPPLPAELEAFVHRHSEGNPLFIRTILEHLIAQGHLKQVGSKWEQRVPVTEMEQTVPDELAQMIELEFQALAPEDLRLLEAASLFSVAFPAWGVAAALQQDLTEIEEAFDSLARRLPFIRRAGHDELPDGSRSAFYVFTHGLYREVLYGRQASTRRAQRHTRVAQRLAALFAGREAHVATEIAQHHEAAGNWLEAVQALRAAAEAARNRNAHSAAVELLQDAMRIAENLERSQREAVQRELRNEMGAPGRPIGAMEPVWKV